MLKQVYGEVSLKRHIQTYTPYEKIPYYMRLIMYEYTGGLDDNIDTITTIVVNLTLQETDERSS